MGMFENYSFNEHKFTGFLTCPIQILLEQAINRRNEREKRAENKLFMFRLILVITVNRELELNKPIYSSRMDVSISDSNGATAFSTVCIMADSIKKLVYFYWCGQKPPTDGNYFFVFSPLSTHRVTHLIASLIQCGLKRAARIENGKQVQTAINERMNERIHKVSA